MVMGTTEDEELERASYHEAGHAVLAFRMNFSDMRVAVFSPASQGRLGSTEYLRDRTRNLNMDIEFGKCLLIMVQGGILGEKIFCLERQIPFRGLYCDGDRADAADVLHQMLLPNDASERKLIDEVEKQAREIISQDQVYVRKIAKLLMSRPNRYFYFSDLAEIIDQGR